jgi:DNA helicase IV
MIVKDPGQCRDSLLEESGAELLDLLGEKQEEPTRLQEASARRKQLLQRLTYLASCEQRLCFGRLDFTDDESVYIGRVGLVSEETQERLLIDWRAPIAGTFYKATAAAPMEVERRRHIYTRDRSVVGLSDEILDSSLLSGEGTTSLRGEGALLAAVSSPRTGRMQDIVETIQHEQDRIIRSAVNGILVVQGGPGTGKTAVALHRAAYILFSRRKKLSSGGILILGPSDGFVEYIAQVLPSLGENDILVTTVHSLVPGVKPEGDDPQEIAALKADLRMCEVLAEAVRVHGQRFDGPREIVKLFHPPGGGLLVTA